MYRSFFPQQNRPFSLDDPVVVERIPTTRLQRPDGSPYASTRLKKLARENILWIGPGGGSFFAEEDLAALNGLETLLPNGSTLGSIFGIKENVVSIFALGPISETTARLIATDLRLYPIGGQQPLQQPDALLLRLRRDGLPTDLGMVASPPDVAADTLAARTDGANLEYLILFRCIASLPVVRLEGDPPDDEFVVDLCASLDGSVQEPRLAVRLKGCSLAEADGTALLARLQADVILQAALKFRLKPTSDRPQEFTATLCFGADGKILPEVCEKRLGLRR